MQSIQTTPLFVHTYHAREDMLKIFDACDLHLTEQLIYYSMSNRLLSDDRYESGINYLKNKALY